MKKTMKQVSATTCECGNEKKASKPTCTFCSFLHYIRSTKETIATDICACSNHKQIGELCCVKCKISLEWYLDLRTKQEGLDRKKFWQTLNRQGIGVAGKCSLCEGNYIFGGNNPKPVINDYDARLFRKV